MRGENMADNSSLPTRERGLKFVFYICHAGSFLVAPHAGAWVEIVSLTCVTVSLMVAPHAGAWVEIT